MRELSRQLHWFVKHKLSTDPLYQSLETCVVSDASVPGEGEHKMLEYIRQRRQSANYDPNVRHCFYGGDADLIMLSLLTHEPHFSIIREEHVNPPKRVDGINRFELFGGAKRFCMTHISLLREYFSLEFKDLDGKLPFGFNIERIIDDFIFICFFIGNDFLPTCSALDIADGSLDKLMDFYKELLPTLPDYVTKEGTVHWDRAEKIIAWLGTEEHEVFLARIDQVEHRRREEEAKKLAKEANRPTNEAAAAGIDSIQAQE